MCMWYTTHIKKACGTPHTSDTYSFRHAVYLNSFKCVMVCNCQKLFVLFLSYCICSIGSCKTWNHPQISQITHKPSKPSTNQPQASQNTHKPTKLPTNQPQTSQTTHKAAITIQLWRTFMSFVTKELQQQCKTC